ncbi:hypothetical protein QS257_19625 [Terrilactibacillus sp. S3-3]|nr:hypothetical protein QS257_19625 [Terrilactibacillus sp. S3-3]
MLNTPDVQNKLISNIVNFATSHNYGGVSIDFEGVLTADREKFVAFFYEL